MTRNCRTQLQAGNERWPGMQIVSVVYAALPTFLGTDMCVYGGIGRFCGLGITKHKQRRAEVGNYRGNEPEVEDQIADVREEPLSWFSWRSLKICIGS